MSKVLIAGCGDLGTAIALQFNQLQHEVIGLRISAKRLPNNMQTIQADVTEASTLNSLTQLNPDILIYCVAANAQTSENYYAHYVQGLKNVLSTQLNNLHLRHVFFVSSTRVYGKNLEDLINEEAPAIPSDFGGERLLEAENLLKTLECSSTALRLSGIYGEGRLSLVNLAKEPNRWPASNNWTNRIHRDDAAAFITFLVNKSLRNESVESHYIVTDDLPTLQYEVLTWLAYKQGINISDTQVPAVQGGKRLSNKRLRDSGFQLQYPHYQSGYSKVLGSLKL